MYLVRPMSLGYQRRFYDYFIHKSFGLVLLTMPIDLNQIHLGVYAMPL